MAIHQFSEIIGFQQFLSDFTGFSLSHSQATRDIPITKSVARHSVNAQLQLAICNKLLVGYIYPSVTSISINNYYYNNCR